MGQHTGWNALGFGFVVEMREDGTPWIKVTDPWYNKPESKTPGTVTLKLQPYASYEEAREIANFLNSRILCGTTPILSLQGGAAAM